MKKIIIASAALVSAFSLAAQQKEGKVTYNRVTQMTMVVSTGPGTENTMPQTRTDRFELNFANNQMVWKQLEDEMEDDPIGEGTRMVVRSFGGGADDIVFCDFDKVKKVELREFMDKKYLISDSIRRGNWKLGEQTKTILGHVCRMATSERIGKRMLMSMDNGKMERKEVDDTSTIIAWFTTDFPVPAGPEIQGQLPGLILELETNNGKTVYTATEIKPTADQKSIKEPSKGKKVTQAEFVAERKKILDEMQENNSGRSIRIRM